MQRRSLSRAGALALTITLAGCQPHAQSSVAEPADLAGRVLDVQMVRSVTAREVRPAPGTPDGATIHRLHIRVASARRAAPGTEAYIAVDRATLMSPTHARPVGNGGEIQGAFVRVWFRGGPSSQSPTETVAMARAVIVDSLAP
jgi:hypothetical protein